MAITKILRLGLLASFVGTTAWLAANPPCAVADAAQDRAIQAVRDVDGIVVRDRQLPGHPVTVVRFLDKPADSRTLAQLASFADLRELDIQTTIGSDADLRLLGGLRHLRKLLLNRAKITDAGVATIAGLPELEELELIAWNVTDDGLKSLTSLRHLRVLHVACRSDGSGLVALKDLPNLQVLNLDGTKTSPELLRKLRVLSALKELDLDCNGEVTDAGLKLIAELPGLEKLTLFSEGITDDGLKALATSRSIKSLRLYNHSLTGSGIKSLRGLTTLEELVMHVKGVDCLEQAAAIGGLRSTGSMKATDLTLHELRALPHLRALKLEYTMITDAGLKELRDMVDLEELDLSTTKVTDAGMVELTGLKKLRKLKLVGTTVSDAAMPSIAQLTNLRELELPPTVGEASLDMLSRLPLLEVLKLQSDALTDQAAVKFALFPSLTSLEISTEKMTNAAMKQLEKLKNLQQLRVWPINRGPTMITDVAFHELQDALPYTEIRRR
jgi:internalin A